MSCKTCERIRQKWREVWALRDIRRAQARAREKRTGPPFRNIPPELRNK